MKKSYLISFIIITASLVLLNRLEIGSNVIVVDKRLDKFPRTIGEYQSIDIPLESDVIRILDTDVFIFRRYISQGGNTITFYIGFYGTKKGGRSDHSPRGCYPGAGWAIAKEEKVELIVRSGDSSRRVFLNMLYVSKGSMKEIVYHWYQTDRQKIISSGVKMNINKFMSRLMYNRNDGAFVRVSSEVNGNPELTRKRLEQFIRDIYPLIIEYWPHEKDI